MLARWVRVLSVMVVVLGTVRAGAQTAKSVVSDDETQPDPTTAAKKSGSPRRDWFMKKFAGSMAEASTFVGSGSFYASGYHHSYAAGALYLKPQYNFGTPAKLNLNARVYLVYEFTDPDNNSNRRFTPLDMWIWLAGGWTEKHTKIRITGQVRVVLPTSYESRYNNLVMGTATGFGLSRKFEWGRSKDWSLGLNGGLVFTKNWNTTAYRAGGPGDDSGCRAFNQASIGAVRYGEVGDSDVCGGPLNTSYSLVSNLGATLGWKKLSLSVLLVVLNGWRYAFDNDQYAAANSVARGRIDTTWGMVSLGYDITDHFSASLGLSSTQPALNNKNDGVRFPFFDVDGTNSANYTQLFVSFAGTL